MFSYKIYTGVLALLLSHATLVFGGNDRKPHKNSETALLVLPDVLPSKALQAKTIATPHEAELHSGATWSGLTNEGIDVSHYQGEIDWNTVARTKLISYVYIKASEGETLTDDYYRTNIEGAKKAGLKVGSYHYYRPDANADLQFNNITSQIRKEEQDLAPIIDVEKRGSKSHEDFINGLHSFLAKLEKHYGCKPVIYTFQNFYNKYICGHFKGYRMMIARYREDEPTLDDGQTYTAWQYTQRGKIDGIKGYVDRSMVMRDFSVSDLSIKE